MAVLRGLEELFADIPAIEALTQKLEDIRTRAKAAGALNGGGRNLVGMVGGQSFFVCL